MGFYTNVTISNDFWHQIKKDPERFVDAISVMMNEGMNSPLADMIDKRSGRDKYARRYGRGIPQGVVVHKARHADDPQVIVNTYGMHPINAEELPTAIAFGWLDENDHNEKHAEVVAQELHRLARSIRHEVRQATERRDETGSSRDQRLDRPTRPVNGS